MLFLHRQLGNKMDKKKVIKTCSCCDKDHYDYGDLTYIGSSDLTPHYGYYNCSCGSTLLIEEGE